MRELKSTKRGVVIVRTPERQSFVSLFWTMAKKGGLHESLKREANGPGLEVDRDQDYAKIIVPLTA